MSVWYVMLQNWALVTVTGTIYGDRHVIQAYGLWSLRILHCVRNGLP
jgi:hypothetical protein